MGPLNLPQQIQELLTQSLFLQDSQVEVQVERNSFGWLRLYVVTSLFEQKSVEERKRQIDSIFATLDLKLDDYPFSNYQLFTPEEALEQERHSPVQVPLWSELLLAPDPEKPVFLDENKDENNENRPLIVTFYSFKGGVGRSTSLAFVANILAKRGHRVVMIDFDLEAPGLSFVSHGENTEITICGVLDYLYQRYLTPELNEPEISDCIQQMGFSDRGEELYLIPAGAYDEGYIHRLADLDVRSLYQSRVNPVHQLLQDVNESLKPDIVLIDARTGFTEMGAIALFDQADLGIICFSPSKQSYAGLEWVVKAARKQKKYNGIPDLRFLLTPMPAVAPIQQREWLGQASDWIARHWDVPESVTIDELYYHVPYDPNILTLESLLVDVPENILKSYEPLAEIISASLPEKVPDMLVGDDANIAKDRQKILHELKFESSNAQDIDKSEISTIFQRTGNFSHFLRDQTWLVLGAKGTGKTLLFRLFVEQPATALELARPYKKDPGYVHFVPGHGRYTLKPTLLSVDSLADYERSASEEGWSQFWPNYLLLQLAVSIDGIQQLFSDMFLAQVRVQQDLSQEQVVDWLAQRPSISHSASKNLDALRDIDKWLGQRGQKIWVFYDELDASFGQKERRRRALDALFEWWMEVGSSFRNIAPKILLRSDIWTGLNLTNKTRYTPRTISLRWSEEDLWKLVLRQALETSKTFAALARQLTKLEKEHLDYSAIPLETLRQALFPLWGERMGRTNKAYTYNWVMKRIGDHKDNRFPRSLIQLLQQAIELEKDILARSPSSSPSEVVLRPRSLIDALPFVSIERVAEVRNEYREFEAFLAKLATERSPIALDHLQGIWELDAVELKTLVDGMVEAGILREYPYPSRIQNSDPPRYSVAELYLSGLRMTRLGQR